jgi:hypothetical protein
MMNRLNKQKYLRIVHLIGTTDLSTRKIAELTNQGQTTIVDIGVELRHGKIRYTNDITRAGNPKFDKFEEIAYPFTKQYN